MFVSNLYNFFEEMVYLGLLPIFGLGCLFFVFSFLSSWVADALLCDQYYLATCLEYFLCPMHVCCIDTIFIFLSLSFLPFYLSSLPLSFPFFLPSLPLFFPFFFPSTTYKDLLYQRLCIVISKFKRYTYYCQDAHTVVGKRNL